MRWLSALFWLVVGAALVVMGLANRGIVTLRVLPEALGALLGVSPDLDLPLFLVIIGSAGLGLLLGFVWEWIREIPERAQARATARELDRLRRELARRPAAAPGDVLAVLDAPVMGQAGRR